ncbi:MAG TPA: hypothetical protein VLV86_11075 [Vicinamibacterales bacterium]|nr:hypothetical protein [Vicinamibacterales bacterium]
MIPSRIVLILIALLASSTYAQSVAKNDRGKQPQAPTMSCEQMSASSGGTISVEACKQMTGVQASFESAASDPSASRPGDDKMTCDQIAAEIKQQQFTPPDQAKVTEAQAATTDLKATVEKEQKEVQAEAIKEAAESSLVSRLIPVNAASAAENKKIEAEQKKINERAAKEQAPKAERMFNASASLIGDTGKQIAANPRLAKLFQMANQRHCKMQ